MHGDFKLDNLLFRDDAPDVAAILDVELATLGHPLADLATMLVYHDFEVLKRGAIDAATRDRKPSDETLVESYFAKLRASDSPVAAVDVP